jgi:hypothetical protein
VTLSQQFTASISGTSNPSVTWSVSGSGCTGAACGTIDGNGLFTAPATPPNPQTVTVKATSVADSSKSGTANVKIVHISVTVLPGTTTVALTGTQQFTALVSPSTNVTWSVSGTGCSGSACGTVDNTGLYTAPASLPSPASVKVTATSTVDPAGTNSATVTLVASFNSRFTGTYAFHFSGFDSGGAVYAAGNFQAYGSGNIGNGLEDINRTSGVTTSLPFTGSYSVGSDNRGTLTLTSTQGIVIATYKFALASNGEAIFIEFDNSGTRGAGVIEQATPSQFLLSKISGPYVMGLFGSDSTGKRAGLAGLFAANGAGALISGAADLNDAGTATTSSSVSGTYAVSPSGRGTMLFVAPGVGTFNFAFYIVAQNEVFFVSTDSAASSDRLGGLGLSQVPGAYSSASFTGNGVFKLTGLDGTTLSNVVAVGLLNFDGVAKLASGSMFDANNAGQIISQPALSGSYSMAGNGRGTLTLTGAAPMTAFVMYAITKNDAFLLDVASSAALSGMVEPQASTSFGPTSIQGVFVPGTTTTANTKAANVTGLLNMDGVSALTGTQDESTPLANTPNESVTGTYTVGTNGRGTMNLTITAPSSTTNRVFYIINNSKFEAIGVDPGDTTSTVIASLR